MKKSTQGLSMKVHFSISAFFVAALANAQSDKEEIDILQASYGMGKKEAVAKFVKLAPNQKDAFWKVYDEYEVKRKELGRQRIALLKQYAEHHTTLSSEQADHWTKQVMELQKKTDDLLMTYYDKIKGVSDGLVATQFYQIENVFLVALRQFILKNLPFTEKSM